MYSSKAASLGNMVSVGQRQTMEANAGPLELMTLPTPVEKEYSDNYSGESRNRDEEDTVTLSAAVVVEESETETEGSGGESKYPGVLEQDVNGLESVGSRVSPETEPSLRHSEVVTEAGHTWQLVDQTTGSFPNPQEQKTSEQAAGETMDELYYKHLHTDNLTADSSLMWGATPSTSTEEIVASTAETSMETLTISQVTTPRLLMTGATKTAKSATSAVGDEHSSQSVFTEKPFMSTSWAQEGKEETTSSLDFQDEGEAPPAPTTGVVPSTTDAKVNTTEIESRSAVSDSFVLGSWWTPFKGMRQKTEDIKEKETADNRDTNPFDIFVPNWAIDLFPRGKTSQQIELTLVIIIIIMSDYLISDSSLNYV